MKPDKKNNRWYVLAFGPRWVFFVTREIYNHFVVNITLEFRDGGRANVYRFLWFKLAIMEGEGLLPWKPGSYQERVLYVGIKKEDAKP